MKALYQQHIYLNDLEKEWKGSPPLLEDVPKNCHKTAGHLKFFELHDQLEALWQKINDKNVVESLEEEICLLTTDKKTGRNKSK